MVNELLHGLYSQEYMARHSLAGGGGKAALDANIVQQLIGESKYLIYTHLIVISFFYSKWYNFSFV